MITARPAPVSPPARWRARSKPFSSPSAMSTSTTSGRSALAWRRASAMLDAVPATTTPSRASRRRAVSMNAPLSSTSRQGTRQVWQQGRVGRIAGSRKNPAPASWSSGRGPARPGPGSGRGRVLIRHGPARRQLDLGQFGVQLAYLVLTPDRRAEPVMGDRRHHEEPGFDRGESAVQPVGTLHVCFLPRVTATVWLALAGSCPPGRPEHRYYGAAAVPAPAARPAPIPVFQLAGRPGALYEAP